MLGGLRFGRCSWTLYTQILSNDESSFIKLTILSGARFTVKTLIRIDASKKYSSVVTIPNESTNYVSD